MFILALGRGHNNSQVISCNRSRNYGYKEMTNIYIYHMIGSRFYIEVDRTTAANKTKFCCYIFF